MWSIRETDVYLASAIVNASLILSHASSTTPNRFWHVATFCNLGLLFLLSKQERDEKKEPAAPTPRDITLVVPTEKKKKRVKTKKGKVAVEEKKTPAFKPIAGSTTVQVVEPRDSTVIRGHTFTGWRPRPAETIMIRSHGYKSTKKKIPSPGSIYDCVTFDIFESQRQCLNMAKRVVLPKVNFDDGPGPKTWHAPDIFVISVALPTEAPSSLFASSKDDGVGYTICMYFVMREDTREILRRVTAADYDPSQEQIDDVQKSKVNAVKLFEQWCRRAPNDPDFQARFKFLSQITNVKEAGIPSWMHAYNGKPLLIKRKGTTGFLYSHPELSAMEFDVSLHPFPNLAKQGFSYLYQNLFQNLVVAFAFVVESREEDELPECIIGLAEVCYPAPVNGLKGVDIFAGTSPKSHEKEEE